MQSDEVLEALRSINQCWLEGRPRDMKAFLHPEIVMVFPGFSGSVSGCDAFLNGFVEFCGNCGTISFQESDHQVDRFDDTAVASFHFDMIYERDGARYRSTGRDIWVFSRRPEGWLACWRTMVEVNEEPA